MIKRYLIAIGVISLPCVGWANAAAADSAAADPGSFDITQISLEQLAQTEFIPASRVARQISDAPSAVSIVTAQDIHDFGYRSIADILNSMRGLYVTGSLGYDYLGGRGFGTPGDYAGRIMLMIDGYATNDNFYNQIFLGEDSLLDVEMIERVEFIPGPGSTTYGNGAFLGVINIVTKRGSDFGGVQVALGFGEDGARRQRVTYGNRLQNGAEFLLSASHYDDDGRSIRFPALDNWVPDSGDPYTNQAIDGLKDFQNRRVFVKGSYEGWSFELAHNHKTQRDNAFLNYLEPSDMGRVSPGGDDNGFASLKYDTDFGAHLKSSSHLYYGQYLYNWQQDESYANHSVGRWWGADFKFVGTWFDRHKLLFGTEYRNDYAQHFSDDINNIDTRRHTASLYVQDEISLSETLTLTPGLRYDHSSMGGSAMSPRLAAVYQPWSASTFKLSYGKAFRYANAWEQWDRVRAITPESVATTELVWQQQFSSKSRLTASVYRTRVSDAITWSYDKLNTSGQELGIEHVSDSGFRINASVTHQSTKDDHGRQLINLPHWLGKLNIAQPLFQRRAMLGFEVQTRGRRLGANPNTSYYGPDATAAYVKANTVANLTLSSSSLLPNTHVSVNVRNLFNTRQEDVIQDNVLLTLPDPGRNVWLQMEYDFK